MSDTFKELEKQFYSDGFRLAMNAIVTDFTDKSLSKAVQEMHHMVDEMVASFSVYAEHQNQSPNCRKGCAWCCYQPVFARSYELDNLQEYLKKNFSAQELEAVYARAAMKRSKLSGLKGEALLNSKFPCPLLVKEYCMAYAARPVACRIYLSFDVNSCNKFFKEPENKEAFPALFNFPMRIGRMINEGFRAALKSGGIQVEEYRIEEFNARRGK